MIVKNQPPMLARQWRELNDAHALFGRQLWEWIRAHPDCCGDEWSEIVLPMAERARLCKQVAYDPAKHGEGIEAEPGEMIWWWGD